MALISDDNEITRYIFSESQFSRPDRKKQDYVKIKKSAVAPMTNSQGTYETSVMLTSDLQEEEVDSLGLKYVAIERNEKLIAYFRFKVEPVYENKLKVIHDKNGHDKHCVVVGWPASKEDMMD